MSLAAVKRIRIQYSVRFSHLSATDERWIRRTETNFNRDFPCAARWSVANPNLAEFDRSGNNGARGTLGWGPSSPFPLLPRAEGEGPDYNFLHYSEVPIRRSDLSELGDGLACFVHCLRQLHPEEAEPGGLGWSVH